MEDHSLLLGLQNDELSSELCSHLVHLSHKITSEMRCSFVLEPLTMIEKFHHLGTLWGAILLHDYF